MKYLRVCTTWIPRQLIKLYQYLLSPDHSKLGKYLYPCGYCKFYPSCSQYAYDVLEKYGLFWGGFRVVLRLFRCNPWHQGGIDLP